MTALASSQKHQAVKPSRATAESMATRQRDISVSEFFAKNRHLLGFDNPRKALLTTVKEAVDNSLDACEEAGILPDITVVIEDLSESPAALPARETKAPDAANESRGAKKNQTSRYRVTVVDNGPGIVRKQVENIFGRLLYGSKFHRLKMSRGQQGIGISAAGMYGLITTGKPMVIHTRPSAQKPAHHIELAMNTKTNRAEVTVDEETDDFPLARLRNLTPGTRELNEKAHEVEGIAVLSQADYPTGTSVSIELEGRYQKGRGSVDEFLELTAIANPHARITFVPPGRFSADESESTEVLDFKKGKRSAGAVTVEPDSADAASTSGPSGASVALAEPAVTTETNGVVIFPRAIAELPPETKEIQPHPKGVELGILLQMLKEAEGENATCTLYNFLQDKFSRVSPAAAQDFCKSIGFTSRTKVSDLDHDKAEQLFKELQESKLPPPPTDCLAPIGVQQLLKGMFKGVRAEFYAASSRQAEVYRGRPFLIEAAIAFGGQLPTEDNARVIRFANRVPLLFQQSACSSFKAVIETNWKNYDLQQPRGSAPVGALVVMIHMASVWVPFTSESKEAIADYDEIRKEMKLALMECGRKLGTYLRKRLKMKREAERRDIFERYIGEISTALNAINGVDTKLVYESLLAQARKRTAIADLELDDSGKARKGAAEDPADQEGVIIVEPTLPAPGVAVSGATGRVLKGQENARGARPSDLPPFTSSKAEAAALKVSAMQRLEADDEQPRLIEIGAARRQRGGKAAVKEPSSSKAGPDNKVHATAAVQAKAKSRGDRAREPGSKPVQQARASAPTTPPPAGKVAKPKMRLDPKSGKLVPISESPRLF